MSLRCAFIIASKVPDRLTSVEAVRDLRRRDARTSDDGPAECDARVHHDDAWVGQELGWERRLRTALPRKRKQPHRQSMLRRVRCAADTNRGACASPVGRCRDALMRRSHSRTKTSTPSVSIAWSTSGCRDLELPLQVLDGQPDALHVQAVVAAERVEYVEFEHVDEGKQVLPRIGRRDDRPRASRAVAARIPPAERPRANRVLGNAQVERRIGGAVRQESPEGLARRRRLCCAVRASL